MRLTTAGIFLLLLGCSTTTAATTDGGPTNHPYDATPNSCTGAKQGYVCQSTYCGSNGLIDVEDYFCGSSADYCCGPPGDAGELDASDDVNVFVDGTVFETGHGDAGAPHDAASDVKGDAKSDGTTDATSPTDASAAGDAGHDASGSMTSDGGIDAPRG